MSEVTQSSNYKGFQYYRQLSLDRDEEESEWKFDVNVCQGRQMRISLPKTDSIIPSDWMHFKLYRTAIGKPQLQQLLVLNRFESRNLLAGLDTILKEVDEFLAEPKEEFDTTPFIWSPRPTIEEDKNSSV